jgi:hypothetical protein
VKLLTNPQIEQLTKNGQPQNRDKDHFPVVKLFTPDAQATWLLTELDSECSDIAYGLCDLGMGFPELGDVYMPEIVSLRGKLGLPVERDRHFEAKYPISVYAEAARMNDMFTENASLLEQAKAKLVKEKRLKL